MASLVQGSQFFDGHLASLTIITSRHLHADVPAVENFASLFRLMFISDSVQGPTSQCKAWAS